MNVINQTNVDRLRELSHAVTQGPEAIRRECSMRVPAEPDRDADLVLYTAADEIERLRAEAAFYKRRCELLQATQHLMRDPERTVVCDILANGTLLPDPDGTRYGAAEQPADYGTDPRGAKG